MIQIQNLSYKYSGATENVFDGLTLSFDEGKIFGLLGKNGVGKSTLLHLLSGLLMPREGRILIDGQEPRLRQPSLQEEVFFVPDEFSLPAMPLTRYVKYREPFYPRFSQEILRQCLQDFEIDMHSHLDKLSLGEKKRVLVSFALATQCRVLLMDEPTNGLDIPAKTLFRKLVARHMADDQTNAPGTRCRRIVRPYRDHGDAGKASQRLHSPRCLHRRAAGALRLPVSFDERAVRRCPLLRTYAPGPCRHRDEQGGRGNHREP